MTILKFEHPAMTPIEYALKYASIGWFVFPIWGAANGKCRCGDLFTCKSPGKHPVSKLVPRGQNDATTDPETIKRWWAMMPEAGIAIFLRPSNLVAIDIDPRNGGLDTMSIIEDEHGPLISDVMAFTQGGGEHRLFSHSGSGSLPGKLGAGVDVKDNGYVCVEPTQGVSGKYVWEASSDPLEGAIPSPLPDWMRDLATRSAAPVVSNIGSSRYATPAQIKEIQEAIHFVASDDRDTWVRFGLALCPLGQSGFDVWDTWSQSSKKYDPVDQIRVWRSFKPGTINFESIFFEAQQNGWANPLAGVGPVIEPSRIVSEPAPVTAQPITATVHAIKEIPVIKLPGVLGEVQAWIDATSRKPQPLFAVQTALAFGSVVMGRRYVTSQRNWPSLYFINIGKSGSGKEHAKWALEKLLTACKLERLIGPSGYTSESGVLSALHRLPSHLAVIDEFGKILESSKVKGNVRASGMMRQLMEVWSRADGVLRPVAYSTAGMSPQDVARLEERTVHNPALTLMAMSTPETFYEAVGYTGAVDGFLNRFMVVETDKGRTLGSFVNEIPVPQSVIDWANKTHAFTGIVNPDINPGLAPSPTVINFSRESLTRLRQFGEQCNEHMSSLDQKGNGISEMFGRCYEISMRLSLIIAIGDNRQVIEAPDVEMSTRYVWLHARRLAERLNEHLFSSEFEACCNQVENLIRSHGSTGLTAREMQGKSRRFRALDVAQQNKVLQSLILRRGIELVKFASASGRGRARDAYILGEEDE